MNIKIRKIILLTPIVLILNGCAMASNTQGIKLSENSDIAHISPITPRTPIQESFKSLEVDSNCTENSEKSNGVYFTPITPRTSNIGLNKGLDVVSDKSENSEKSKLSANEIFPREKIDANPLLTKPKIAKIKIQNYIDKDGDYHEPSTVHMIIRESSFMENKKYFSIDKE